MGSSRKTLLVVVVTAALSVMASVPLTAWLLDAKAQHVEEEHAPAAATWVCPMHPAVVNDHQATCPICGMKLVKAAAAPQPATAYVCPMHPEVVKDEPGQCPICNMKLVKSSVAAPPEVESLATIAVDPSRQQLLGLERATVERGPLGGALRASARVSVDETQVRRVSLRVPGYVEKLFVNVTGQTVVKGQPLFRLFSPEVFAAEQEYLVARNGGAGAAAKRKLELWGVPEAELARLEREGVAAQTVTFPSPIAGVVTKKDVVEGARLEAGAMPFELVDLSTVWVLADVYEQELRFVSVGQAARLTLPAWPGRAFDGTVRFIDPLLDARTRTAKVRVSFSNTDGALKPELFGALTIERPARTVLRVPTEALVRGGTRDVAFVARADAHFEPREVVVGEVTR
jgi:Cu(I)/Ag(I) efflux system membrane fusion protein